MKETQGKTIAAGPYENRPLPYASSSIDADETRVLFLSNRAGGWNLYSAPIASGAAVQLTDSGKVCPSSPVLSAAEPYLYYAVGGRAARLHLDTLEERTLADFDGAVLDSLSLNADETALVAVVRKDASDALARIQTDGSDAHIFFDPPRSIRRAHCCPANPLWVLYSSRSEQRMWTVTIRGWKDRPLYLHRPDESVECESFLGKSETVLFIARNGELKAIERNGERLRPAADIQARSAAASRCGRWIAVETLDPPGVLTLINAETGQTRPLFHINSGEKRMRLSFSPSGRRLVFEERIAGRSAARVVPMPAAGLRPSR